MQMAANIDSLPEELVFDILLHLPAQDIYSGARFVCKKWHNIISKPKFIDEHLHHSNPGLIIHNMLELDQLMFVAMRRGKIEISKFNNEFIHLSSSACNGLLLGYDNDGRGAILNPATKKRFDIPVFDKYLDKFQSFGIVHVAATMEYKVVHSFISWNEDSHAWEWGRNILTFGVDKYWRPVHTELQLVPRNVSQYVTEGFTHWVVKEWRGVKDDCVLTLNAETEIMTCSHAPQACRRSWNYYLSTGRSLSMLAPCSIYTFDIWDMESGTGEWTKMYTVDLEPQKARFLEQPERGWFVPVGWLKYKEVLLLTDMTNGCFAYNVLTQEIDSFELVDHYIKHRFGIHTSSLVSL